MDGMSEHTLNFENHSCVIPREEKPLQLWSERVPTGETTVTCSCGLDTGAIPSAEAKEVFEQHWRETHPEVSR